MYSIIPFILIVLSLAVIIFVIVRKFPQLTLLDVDSIPEVKMDKKKVEIYKKKAEDKAKETGEKRKIMMKPVIQKLKDFQLSFRKYVGKIERETTKKLEEKANIKIKTPEEKMLQSQDLKAILQEANQALENNDLDFAEKNYISAIKLDAKNIDAYFGLGKVYMGQEQWDEAIETFKFILQLNPDDVQTLIKLAEISEERGYIEEAVGYYQQVVLVDDQNPTRFSRLADLLESLGKYETALEAVAQAVDIEPQNPKYLDKMIEISVLCGNKKVAEEAYQKLRMVNPENQKLVTLKSKIEEMK